MDAIVREQFEKIAALVAYDVPQRQVANATGLSESRISEIVACEEFQPILQDKTLENFEKHQTLNDGWDMAESMALSNIVAVLQESPDPDFALRAAAVANKANRRGRFNQGAIPAGGAGVRAVINLNAAFVNKLQQNFQITQLDHSEIKQKDADFLSPKNVESLLAAVQPVLEEILQAEEIVEEDIIPAFVLAK